MYTGVKIIPDILSGSDNFQKVYEKLPNKDGVFTTKKRFAGCMDEGDEGPEGLDADKAGFAGPLIGCNFTTLAIEEMKKNGNFAYVTSHWYCGAAVLAANAAKKEGKIPKDYDSDSYGDDKARELAEKLGVQYLGRTPKESLKRPPEVHSVQVAYYDGTGLFVPYKVEGLPRGFLISRGLIPDFGYGRYMVGLATRIALGDHGLGRQFTGETPFHIVMVYQPEYRTQLQQLRTEVRSAIEELKKDKQLMERFKGRLPIKMDTIVRR